jgi:hypothetical protein
VEEFDRPAVGEVAVAARAESDGMPQTTYTYRTTFRVEPDNEPGFRAIRNLYGDHKARDLEGIFYAYEKRCQRTSMMGWHEQPARLVSKLYDILSAYGASYERAFLWLAALQVTFYITYAAMSKRLTGLSSAFDADVLAFTFAQLLKPFELFSSSPSFKGVYTVVDQLHLGLWRSLTLVQSLLSIALIALLLIAVRWRFRRE